MSSKLREAVKAVVDVGYPHNFQKEAPQIRGYCYDITRAIDKRFAALSAPRRNCDVGTAEEQAQRFYNYCKKQDKACCIGRSSGSCPIFKGYKVDCAIVWAQLPYKKEGEA